MEELPAQWGSLLLLVFSLGARHGIDADHLATIDGLTRFSRGDSRISRWCGFLFSLGHGLVVTGVAIVVGIFTQHWEVPHWLDTLGTWISISFLLFLGTLNLLAVIRAKQGQIVTMVGVKSRWFRKLQETKNPFSIVFIGALFALSFDTMSQTALFSLAGAKHGGVEYTVALGIVFTLGMMMADGINGIWISKLLTRADALACTASKIMGLTVAFISFLVAGIGIGKFASPSISEWSESSGFAITVILLITALIGFFVALRSAATPSEIPVAEGR